MSTPSSPRIPSWTAFSLITLSYTFYPIRVPDQAAAETAPPKSGRI